MIAFQSIFFNEITLDCSESPCFSTHAKEKASKASAKHARGGGGARVNNFSQYPPPALSSLPFCAGIQFFHNSICTFNDPIKIRGNRGLSKVTHVSSFLIMCYYVIYFSLVYHLREKHIIFKKH